RRVLLEVSAHDPDLDAALGRRQRDRPVHAERLVVLGDLVALRQVGVEVVLAVEDGPAGDVTAERVAEQDRHLDRALVRHWQSPRMREADRARARVLRREVLELAAAEHLRPRLQVDVDLEPDDRLPAHASLGGTKSNSSARSRAWALRKSRFSENCRPTSCSPTGRPSARPQGIESPGRPAMFGGIASTSERYIA